MNRLDCRESTAARRWQRLTACGAVLLLFLFFPLTAGLADEKAVEKDSGKQNPVEQSEDPDPGDKGDESAAGMRFTNENLPPVHPADKKTADHQSGDEAEETEDEKDDAESLDDLMDAAAEEALQNRIAETRREISMLEMRLSHLESRIKSIRNPFLKGLTPASDEETEAVGGLSNVERLVWVEEQIDFSRIALDEARLELTDLLRR